MLTWTVYAWREPTSGEIVYIGCTSAASHRRNQFKYGVYWWTADLEWTVLDVLSHKWDGLHREAELIREHRPRHNIQHNPDRRYNSRWKPEAA